MNIGKEQTAIRYLRAFQPQDEPYYLCYSGANRMFAQLPQSGARMRRNRGQQAARTATA